MQTVPETPTITHTTAPTRVLDVDLVVLPAFEGDDLADEADLDAASGGEVAAARARGEFAGKLFELFVTTVRGWGASRIALVGAGSRADLTLDRLRRVALTGSLAARQRRLSRIALVHRSGTRLDARDAAQVLAEGVVLANFDSGVLKTTTPRPGAIARALVRVEGEASTVARGVERGRVMAQYTNVARTLANQPSNVLTPRAFAASAQAIATDAGLAVEVLDEARIAELKMGLLMGVARGSAEPPRVVVLRYEPARAGS
jgi:leucyl aminopeptidase